MPRTFATKDRELKLPPLLQPIAMCCAAVALSACGDGATPGSPPGPYEVAVTEHVFVDETRGTPPTGELPALFADLVVELGLSRARREVDDPPQDLREDPGEDDAAREDAGGDRRLLQVVTRDVEADVVHGGRPLRRPTASPS